MTAAALRDGGPNGRIWGMSAAAAAALHLAAAGVALIAFAAEPDDDAGGAPAIEISLAPAAPHVEDEPDAPPGPPSEAVAAAAPAAASMQTKDNDDPKIARVEAEEADHSLSEKHEKPVEDPAKHQATPVISAESAASEAAAPPKSDAEQEAPHAVAPVQGADKAARAAKQTWMKQLMAHIHRHKRYPSGVARRSVTLTVAFTLDRLGHVVASRVQRSSGDPTFDQAALDMMKRADPVPPPPPAIADEILNFSFPMLFNAPKP